MEPNALEHITIRGFRSIAPIEKFPLRPINIVIGANGSGKSNFIEAFDFLSEIGEGRLDEYVTRAGGANRLLHFGRKRTPMMAFDLAFSEPSMPFRVTLQPVAGDRMARGNSIVVLAGFSQCRAYHFHDTSESSLLRLQSKIDDNRALRADGGNLAAFLYRLRQTHPGAYDDIVSVIRQVAPFFLDFQLEPLVLKPDEVKLEWKHTSDDQYFDAEALSDGTLRFMAIATLLLQPPELLPSVVLLDEPELGLHPSAIGVLASMIRQASKSAQVIVSTQSPLLIDYFEPQDIVVADLVNGATTLRRLDPEPLRVWLEDFSLGQLWEKNEIGGRP